MRFFLRCETSKKPFTRGDFTKFVKKETVFENPNPAQLNTLFALAKEKLDVFGLELVEATALEEGEAPVEKKGKKGKKGGEKSKKKTQTKVFILKNKLSPQDTNDILPLHPDAPFQALISIILGVIVNSEQSAIEEGTKKTASHNSSSLRIMFYFISSNSLGSISLPNIL